MNLKTLKYVLIKRTDNIINQSETIFKSFHNKKRFVPPFHGISNYVGYLKPKLFLKKSGGAI